MRDTPIIYNAISMAGALNVQSKMQQKDIKVYHKRLMSL